MIEIGPTSIFQLSDVDELDRCATKFDNLAKFVGLPEVPNDVVFTANLRSDVISIQTLLQGVNMGNYAIHIEGTGAHHNGVTADADHIMGEAVKALKHHGHTVYHASLTYGSRETHAGDEHDARSPVTATSSSPQVVVSAEPVTEITGGTDNPPAQQPEGSGDIATE